MLRPRRTSRTSVRRSKSCLIVLTLLLAISGFAQNPASEELRRGIELYKQNDYVAASEVLKKVTERDKLDAEGWSYLGLSFLHQPKRIKDASKAFQQALKLKPDLSTAHVGLAYSFLLRNKSSEAVREARIALTADPNIAEAHYIIGLGRLRAGDRKEALQEAEATIKLNSDFAEAYLLKSQALASFFAPDVLLAREEESAEDRSKRFAQAADALENYLRLNPNTVEKQTWLEQLESLRFFGRSHAKDSTSERVFTGKEVTTRARVLRKPEPQYTNDARSAQATGTVVLRAVFAADGKVKHILVVSGLPYGLTEASIRAARKIVFAPATIDGRPVSTFIQLEYNFNLF